MNCPNCMFELTKSNICSNCGIDIILFKNIIKISNNFYNEALNKANENNLTGAIENLVKSIRVNKNNLNSRNLLGLIYFEIGYIGEALKQWVISSSLMKEDNLAIGYLDSVQKNGDYIEKLNNSTIMYNKALESLKNQNEDLTVIQLKKVIELNPNFLDAINLLALCYIIQNNKNKAKEYIQMVLGKDNGNTTAMCYYKEVYLNTYVHLIKQGESVKTVSKPVADKKIYYNAKNTKEKQKKDLLMCISLFSIGFILGGILLYGIFMPLRVNYLAAEIVNLKDNYEVMEQSYMSTINLLNDEVLSYKDENENLTVRVEEFDRLVEIEKKTQLVEELEVLFARGENMEVARTLYSEDFGGVAEDVVNRIEYLKGRVYPSVATNLYNSAIRSFNNRQYNEAKEAFLEALNFSSEEARITPDIIYHLGLIEEINSNFEEAKKYFNDLVQRYPASTQALRVQHKL